MKFRVELVWQGSDDDAASIYLTSDGRVILQGRAVSPQERSSEAMSGRSRRRMLKTLMPETRNVPFSLRAGGSEGHRIATETARNAGATPWQAQP